MVNYGCLVAFAAVCTEAAWHQASPYNQAPASGITAPATVPATGQKIMQAPTQFPEMTPLSWAELPVERGAFRTPRNGLCIAARLFSMVKYQMDQCLVQFPLTALPVQKSSLYQEAGVKATKVVMLETGMHFNDNPYFDSRWCAKASDKWGLIARGIPYGFPNVLDGQFVTVLGSANSYGGTIDNGKAWTELLGASSQTQFINIATGGAGPGYYLAGWPQFGRFLTKAKAVVVQVMSGRSVAIPRFLGGGNEMLEMAVLGCDLRWKVNGQGVDVLPFLQTLWRKNVTTARTLLNEMRAEQEAEYTRLFAKIRAANPATKIILMWMSKRDLDDTYRPEDTEKWGQIMDFPHFVDKTMVTRMAAGADYFLNIKRPSTVTVDQWQWELVPNHYCGCQTFSKDVCTLSEYRNNYEKGQKCACKAVHQDYYSTSTVHAEVARQVGAVLSSF